MLLSVCLITKNEEQFLAGCLESVRSVAGEIILVDTGSADRTVEIAQRYGCRVLHRAWDDDFSAARNAGIAAAQGQWILCLDADERLAHSERLPAALADASPATGGFLLERHDIVVHPEDGQSDVYPVEILRLFRNHPDIRYEGIVHERPNETVLRAGLEIRSLALRLTHLVSHLPQDRLEAKQQRYLSLLNLELERDDRNFWARYYRGKTLWFLRRLEEAQSEFQGIVDDDGCPPSLRASAWCMQAALLSEEGLRGAAVEAVQKSLTLIPEQSLTFYVLAEILYADGRFAQAREAYRRVRLSLDPDSAPSQVLGDLYMTREKRGYKLGCCSLALGEIAEAESHFSDGLAGNPSHGGCHYGLARAALLRGDFCEAIGGAIEHLEEAIKNDPAWEAPRELLTELRASLPPPAPASGSSRP